MKAQYLSILLVLAACEVLDRDRTPKQDTTVITPSVGDDTARRSADTMPASGVPAVPDSARSGGTQPDTGVLKLDPAQPRRGGVLFVLAHGLNIQMPRCAWKGAPLPCHRASGGVRAFVPLPADEPAGTYTLTIDRPSGRISREIVIADHDFGRELVLLDDSSYSLVRRSRDVARDARAVRQSLSAQTAEQLWSGRWILPLEGAKSSGYGVERFYYLATDSTRVLSLGPSLRAHGAFGADTTTIGGGEVPGWRHSGVDMAARLKSAVHAPAAGIVSEIGDYILTGRTLILDHGQGVSSAFFHLDTVLVRKGDQIRRGVTIARVGETGLATGPHLHYGVYLHGKDVDPAAWRAMPEWVRGDTSSKTATRR